MLDFRALFILSVNLWLFEFSVCRLWTGQRTGTKPCSSRSIRFTKQVSLFQVTQNSINLLIRCYFNWMFWSELVRHAHVCICGWVSWFLLNQICWRSPNPELIRRENWEKPPTDARCSGESALFLLAWHSEYKACLFIIALGFSASAHTFTQVCVPEMSSWWMSPMINI